MPNPHVGLREIRSSANFKPEGEGWEPRSEARYDERTGERLADRETWVKYSTAAETAHGKFYTVHLQDASAEDRATIEQHLGLKFEFTDDGVVRWMPWKA